MALGLFSLFLSNLTLLSLVLVLHLFTTQDPEEHTSMQAARKGERPQRNGPPSHQAQRKIPREGEGVGGIREGERVTESNKREGSF